MFNKKYKKTLMIINEEIDFMTDMFLQTVDLANAITNDVELKTKMLMDADNYHQKKVALCELKLRLYKEIGV